MKVPKKIEKKLEGLGILVPYKTSVKLEALKIAKKIGKPHICKNCHEPFERSYRQTHDKFLFCNQSCHNEWKKKQAILRKQRVNQEKAQDKTVFSFCMWCGRKLIFREKRRYCRSECGRNFKRIEQRIINTFEKPQIELKRLKKLGCGYSFPEYFQRLNGLYGLPQKRVD